MADPIGTASAVVALVGFAFQSSKLLYETVASFQSNKKIVRELKEELEALEGVLQSLNEAAANADTQFSPLKLPLFRCGQACKDFSSLLVKCTAHSGGPRTSFRDWARLTYMGNDIAGFKNMLAGYKSTILIALGDANIRTSVVTAAVLKEYKELITNTTSDLEDHLQDINDKLQNLSSQDTRISEEDTAERKWIQEERDSTQQCLAICSQVYKHIDQVQLNTVESISTPSGAYRGSSIDLGGLPLAKSITADTLHVCKESLTSATSQLERRLQDVNNRLRNFSLPPVNPSSVQAAEQEKIQEEIESINQCLAICDRASRQADQGRGNVFEDIYMTDDGKQMIVSTIGALITAKRVTAGARSMQFMGQMSDESLQQLSRDHSYTTKTKDAELQVGDGQFETRYGAGVKLSSQT